MARPHPLSPAPATNKRPPPSPSTPCSLRQSLKRHKHNNHTSPRYHGSHRDSMAQHLQSDSFFHLNPELRQEYGIVSSEQPLQETRFTLHRTEFTGEEKRDGVAAKEETQEEVERLPQPVNMLTEQDEIRDGIRGDIPKKGDKHRNHQKHQANDPALPRRPGYAAGDSRRKSGRGKSSAVKPDFVEPWRNSIPMRTVYSTGGFQILCCVCGDGTLVVGPSTCLCGRTVCNICYSGRSDKVLAKSKNGGKRGKGPED